MPLSHGECIARMLRNRGKVSPLLQAPWVKSAIFRFDWLHVCDIGVAADFIGNFFKVVLEFFPGANKKERSAELFEQAVEFY